MSKTTIINTGRFLKALQENNDLLTLRRYLNIASHSCPENPPDTHFVLSPFAKQLERVSENKYQLSPTTNSNLLLWHNLPVTMQNRNEDIDWFNHFCQALQNPQYVARAYSHSTWLRDQKVLLRNKPGTKKPTLRPDRKYLLDSYIPNWDKKSISAQLLATV